MHPDGITVSYLRVSTQVQSTEGEGMEIQKNKIQEHCSKKGYRLERSYEDRGISGTTIKDRPGLLQLLKDCESGTIKRIIVFKSDRLARELTVALWLEKEFKKYDVELESVEDPPYDMEDPLQKAFKRIADIFAELERDIIAVRLQEGRINAAKNGTHLGAVPYGLIKVGDKLELNSGEAPYVRQIFRWFLKGHRYQKIADILNSRGITTKQKKKFQIQTIRNILSNDTYTGVTSYGPITVKGAHPAIIGRRTFLNAQKKIKHRHINLPNPIETISVG